MNVIIGYASGMNSGSGNFNVFLGHQAGYDATGSKNVFIGNEAGRNETGSELLIIDNSPTSTPLIHGNFANGSEELTINGKVTIADVLKLKPRATPPGDPVEGEIYYNSADHMLYVWNGSAWKACW
jgi:hypothetical protein